MAKTNNTKGSNKAKQAAALAVLDSAVEATSKLDGCTFTATDKASKLRAGCNRSQVVQAADGHSYAQAIKALATLAPKRGQRLGWDAAKYAAHSIRSALRRGFLAANPA